MTMIWSVRVFMLSNRFDGPGDFFAAVPQREGSAIDGYELELVVLVVVGDSKTGPDFKALAAHDESRRTADLDRPRRGELGREDLQDLPVAQGGGGPLRR